MGGQAVERLRSIPARAGEPLPCAAAMAWRQVYPRSRGGTGAAPGDDLLVQGLSPLARGNRLGRRQLGVQHRSIPARAGEPLEAHLPRLQPKVYPRSRGGTRVRKALRGLSAGLSPLARGNRCLRHHRRSAHRSIPARAGEPARKASRSPTIKVYPRSRGGTSRVDALTGAVQGLSPLARGNHERQRRDGQLIRSIPARAGEPLKKHFPAEGRCRTIANVNAKSGSGRLLAPRRWARLAPHQIYAVGIHNCLGSLAECAYSLFPYRCGISPGHHN